MPRHPAAIGRDAAAGIAPPQPHPQTPDPDAAHRRQHADARNPQHDLPPQRTVLAQQGGIDPVRYRSEPVPDALGPRGIEHDLTATGGNVELRAIGVAERDEKELRRGIESRGDAPLVAIDGAGRLHTRRSGMSPHHRQRLFKRDAVDDAAINRREPFAAGHRRPATDRPAHRSACSAAARADTASARRPPSRDPA